MKGIINITLDNEIEIYIKASNLQGTTEGIIKRKNWNEILNNSINIETFISDLTISNYEIINDQILKIDMTLKKDTGVFHFNLELKNIGNNIYTSELSTDDIFTLSGAVSHIISSVFYSLYKLF